MTETKTDLLIRIKDLERDVDEENKRARQKGARAENLATKVSDLKAHIVRLQAGLDRAQGYIDRVQEKERPPERRTKERRQYIHEFDGGMMHRRESNDLYGVHERDKTDRWFD